MTTEKDIPSERAVPQVSIIVLVCNVEEYLSRCLDSILAQTLKDWECICVDDGSTDGSGAVLDEHAARDSRFVVIHMGQSRQPHTAKICRLMPEFPYTLLVFSCKLQTKHGRATNSVLPF